MIGANGECFCVVRYKFELLLNIVRYSMQNNSCGAVRVSVVLPSRKEGVTAFAAVPDKLFANIPIFALNKRTRQRLPRLICLITAVKVLKGCGERSGSAADNAACRVYFSSKVSPQKTILNYPTHSVRRRGCRSCRFRRSSPLGNRRCKAGGAGRRRKARWSYLA